ncbi:MFS transporter [Rhodopila globiformis]|nr:MFS transporter [Rhodopila globiformis]
MQRDPAASIEGPPSWRAALLTLAILSVSFGSPLLVIVGLRDMQAALHTDRSVLSLASALVWIGNGVGGIPMGWVADRIGIRLTVLLGALCMAGGLALSSVGSIWALLAGHGLFIGLLGNGAMYAPLIVYVSRWFDRRRGTAIALISSGQYVAGIIWPTLFGLAIARYGWQATMLGYGAVVLATVLPILALLHPSPGSKPAETGQTDRPESHRVAGLPPNLVMGLICLASFCCCVPMALPSSHLVAFCGDIGIKSGAAMMSVLTACAFVSRQFWGAFADRFGGLRTVMAGSTLQMLTIAAFMTTRNEAALFAIAGAYGLGFSGIIPAYSVAIRDLFPSHEAAWRLPTVLFTAMSGMAFGSWFAGRIVDVFASYRPAFAAGILFNLMNLAVIVFLVSRTVLRRDAWLASVAR